MSFFKKLFKRKAGGTFVGNLIRGATSNIPGVGALASAINQPLTAEQIAIRQGKSNGTSVATPGVAFEATGPVATITAPRVNVDPSPGASDSPPGKTIKVFGKEYPVAYAWGALAAGVAAWYFLMGPGANSTNGRRKIRR